MEAHEVNLTWNLLCLEYRGRLLEGKYAHECWAWDGLPIDETCPEWPCWCSYYAVHVPKEER